MAQLKALHTIKAKGWQHPIKIGHNTKAWRDLDGSYSIRYHSTVVVNWDAANCLLYVNTNGWFSKTTLERIRFGLDYLGLSLSTNDIKGHWRVMDRKGNAFTIRGNNIKLALASEGWKRIIA